MALAAWQPPQSAARTFTLELEYQPDRGDARLRAKAIAQEKDEKRPKAVGKTLTAKEGEPRGLSPPDVS